MLTIVRALPVKQNKTKNIFILALFIQFPCVLMGFVSRRGVKTSLRASSQSAESAAVKASVMTLSKYIHEK